MTASKHMSACDIAVITKERRISCLPVFLIAGTVIPPDDTCVAFQLFYCCLSVQLHNKSHSNSFCTVAKLKRINYILNNNHRDLQQYKKSDRFTVDNNSNSTKHMDNNVAG